MNILQKQLLRLPQVKSITGLSKSSIYARISQGSFPRQISLGPRRGVWVDSDIQEWIGHQIQASSN